MMTSNTLPRRLVLHRSLIRPILIGGAQRSLVMLNGTLIATLVLGVGFHPITLALAFILATFGHWCLVQATQSDAQMTGIYLRHIRYSHFYPAQSSALSMHRSVYCSVPIE